MCGIVGVNFANSASVCGEQLFKELLAESISRGQDSSGALFVQPHQISILKLPIHGRSLGSHHDFLDAVEKMKAQDRFVAFGHSRMETHGTAARPENNHPIVSQNVAVLHNGIIVNSEEIWIRHPDHKSITEVDSEVLCLIIRKVLQNRASDRIEDITENLKQALSLIKGSYSFIATEPALDVALVGTNTGSLWIATDSGNSGYALASEKKILRNAFAACKISSDNWKVTQAPLREVLALPLGKKDDRDSTAKQSVRTFFSYPQPTPESPSLPQVTVTSNSLQRLLDEGYAKARKAREAQRHCARCILPASMPLISFNEEGVCNYCTGYKRTEIAGQHALVERLSAVPAGTKTIVPFSGGRDSAYALHFLKKELGVDVLAFTYDWGVLTDLGRRNQARMIGSLGVEQILVSADIRRKREFVRKNVLAWLRSPSLGMVPLFMAGDKHYFYHLHLLRNDFPDSPVVYSDNRLEASYFKYGFAGVANRASDQKPYDVGVISSLQLLWFYARQFLSNPGYWNNSLCDSLSAYWASFFVPKNFIHIYKHIRWNEQTIVNTLVKEYEWELAKDTASSWRIGDGTAAFYNYIYFVMGGLTEHDTFRSNQIREGLISREEALSRSLEDASPRADSISWYFETLGIDPEIAIKTINKYALCKSDNQGGEVATPKNLQQTLNTP